jgi:hypothetical protein
LPCASDQIVGWKSRNEKRNKNDEGKCKTQNIRNRENEIENVETTKNMRKGQFGIVLQEVLDLGTREIRKRKTKQSQLYGTHPSKTPNQSKKN